MSGNETRSREIKGTVKWFDLSKGYGFIASDPEGEDVMLHISAVREYGVEPPREGDLITCSAVRREKGLQATKILDFQQEDTEPAPLGEDEDIGDYQRGYVKWFNRVRGYGFLCPENPDNAEHGDVFMHAEVLAEAGLKRLETDDVVLYQATSGPKGQTATKVRALPK